ncbi:MAG: efflux RND transporter periplasmic adaptor subunit, partial [Chthoniobacteraceae bacterium]
PSTRPMGRALNMTARIALQLALPIALLALGGCKKSAGGPPGGFATQVVAVKAVREAVSEQLRVIGTVLANETVDLQAEADGRVTAIHFEEGQRVEVGQLLIEMDSSEVEARLSEAEASARLAQSKWDRTRELLANRTLSQEEADEAKAQFDMANARVAQIAKQLRDMKIKAPFSGIIGSRQISPGQVISRMNPGRGVQTIATLSDIDPVKVEGAVPERFLALAKVGAKLQLSIAAFPGEKFEGELYFVAPHIDPVNRTALVKARVPNADLRLKPGMFASADLSLRVKDDAIIIPEAALMPQGERFAVIVVDGDLTAHMRPVKPGVRMAGRAEIVEGLKEGELVVVEGWQKTRPGGKVTLAPADKAAPYTAAAK